MNIERINKEKVKKIANLADLEIKNEEMPRFVKDFKQILKFLNRLNQPHVSPISQKPQNNKQKQRNYLRKDRLSASLPLAKIFKNTESNKDNYFTVPKILNNKVKKE